MCAALARYGAPGDEVLAWLKGGGDILLRERFDEGVEVPPLLKRQPLGMSMGLAADFSTTGRACLGGRLQACEAVFLSPAREDPTLDAQERRRGVEQMPFPLLTNMSGGTHFGVLDQGALSALENEFGLARFSMFWRSQAPVTEAFQGAFGISVGEWQYEWIKSRTGLRFGGPGMRAAHVSLSLLTLLGLAGLSVATAKRKREV